MSSSKHRRVLHIGLDKWYWWVASGRYSEATHVTIYTPLEKYHKILLGDILGISLCDDMEGIQYQIEPSKVKEYIISNLIDLQK